MPNTAPMCSLTPLRPVTGAFALPPAQTATGSRSTERANENKREDRNDAPTDGLIGAPTSAGAFAPGPEQAPAALRAAGLTDTLRLAGADIEDYGDVPGCRWAPDRDQP